MPESVLPLKMAKASEKPTSIDLIDTMEQLLAVIASYMVADSSSVLNDFPLKVVDDLKSGDCSSGKVLFVKGNPCKIVFDKCTIYQYPPNVPLLFEGSVPSYMSELSQDERDSFGLTTPNSGTWAIFRPS